LSLEMTQAGVGSPAIVALMSHPPVEEDIVFLNVELLMHCFQAIRSVRGRPTRVKTVAAVDWFGLDTLSFVVSGLYAGLMNTAQFGLDRESFNRNWFQRTFLFRQAEPYQMVGRIRRFLKDRGDIVMAQSGGVPPSGRLLYVIREGVWQLRRAGPRTKTPFAVLEAMDKNASFNEFRLRLLKGEPVRVWRLIESWLLFRVKMNLLQEKGFLDADARDCYDSVARAFGISQERTRELGESFMVEFAREVPYRERLLRFLVRRKEKPTVAD